MHEDILSDKQLKLLPFIKRFKKTFYLADGTAITLHIGHRRSIDFDLFTSLPLNKKKIQDEIRKYKPQQVQPLLMDFDQQHFIINGVKCTFLHFPYPIPLESALRDIVKMPSLLDLASMKAFALSRISRWKDYVDMYFLLKEFSLKEILDRAKEFFPSQITEKLFRSQLSFHKDIDYDEEVDYVVNNPPSQEEVKSFLIEVATTEF